MVRVKETFDSLAMLEFALDNMPDTPLLTEGFSYKPHAFALGFVEAPRGEDVHWSMLGDNQKIVPLALSCRHLRQLAGAALHATRQYRF